MLGDNILFVVFLFLAVCAVAFGLVLRVVFFFKDKRYTPIRRIRFFFAFGIWPKTRFSETLRKIVQKIIDSKLTDLANEYSHQDKDERYFHKQLQDLEFEKDEQKAIKEYLKWEKLLVRQKGKLNKAKKKFWRAWNLANWYGYSGREKHTDYLPSAENQKS